jgi:hypothetical protein
MPKRMLLEYITNILWTFALKCYEDRMNNLVHRTDGQTPYQALLGLGAALINIKNFHTFGCPCYFLDHCLQWGDLMIPNGNHEHEWVCTLDIHSYMLQMFH